MNKVMNDNYYLIVEQSTLPPEYVQSLLQLLATNFNLDIYLCRQRLLGKGLSLLTKGSLETLEKITLTLSEYKVACWLISPTKPAFVPQRIRSLQVNASSLSFGCQKKSVVFPKGSKVLAVFADLSGELANKSVKQLLTSHAYRGRDNVEHIQDGKIFQTILQGTPVLDLYLLDSDNSIVDGVRAFPGKFDPKGLGDKATLSSRQNLKAVLDLITTEYASELTLRTDFGLVNLPGCNRHRDNPKDPETIRQNLMSLTRYGWLMADLAQAEGANSKPAIADPECDPLTAPMLTATGLTAAQPLLQEIQKTISNEMAHEAETQRIKARNSTSQKSLPPPPEGGGRQRWSTPAFWFGSTGGIAIGLLIAALQLDTSHTLRNFITQIFASGLLTLCLAVLLFWYAFYFLRMKRQIENTPTSRVRSVAMGMVEVKGRALRKYATVSPMTHVACAYYRLTRYRRSKNNNWEVSSVASSHHVPFFLEDDTGQVEIDPSSCRVSAGSRQEGMPGQVGLFHVDSDSHEKWVEETIVEGTLLYVLGYAEVKKAAGPTLSERKQKALRELKQNPQILKKYDTDGDGHISADEWDSARADVENQLFEQSLADNQKRKKQEDHIVIGKRKGRPLIISETPSEEHLTARYLTYSLPLFILAGVATGLSIYLLIKYLH